MRMLGAASLAALILAGTSAAAWSARAAGTASAAATSMPAGGTPTASVAPLSLNVKVTWPASSFPGGGAVDGYVVTRYNATTGASQAVGAGCAGVVRALTCTENNVSVGQWTYSVTPAQGTWRGAEGARSNAVTVPGV